MKDFLSNEKYSKGKLFSAPEISESNTIGFDSINNQIYCV